MSKINKKLKYLEAMESLYADTLSKAERKDLAKWDKKGKPIKDWPGWEKYLGVSPWKKKKP